MILVAKYSSFLLSFSLLKEEKRPRFMVLNVDATRTESDVRHSIDRLKIDLGRDTSWAFGELSSIYARFSTEVS